MLVFASNPRRAFIDALEYGYGPLFVSILFSLLLATQDAVHEVFLAATKDVQAFATLSFAPVRTLLTFISFVFVPVFFWMAAATTFVAQIEKQDGLLGESALSKIKWWPEHEFLLRVIGRAPLLGGGIGVLRAGFSKEATSDQFWLLFGVGVFCVLLSLTALRTPTQKHYVAIRDWIIDMAPYWAGLATLFVYFFVFFPQAADHVGPIAVASISVIILAMIFAILTLASAEAEFLGNFPLVLFLVGLIVAAGSQSGAVTCAILCLFGMWTARHFKKGPKTFTTLWFFFVVFAAYAALPFVLKNCGTLSGCNIIETQKEDKRPELGDVLASWTPPGDEPIRLIAAQGGGLFAAYETAYHIATMADHDPEYVDSILGISGVSGGSFGAAAIWAILQEACVDKDSPGFCHRNKVRDTLRRDYLSGPLAGLLFRDALDGILPISSLFSLAEWPIDRGRVLEKELESNVRLATDKDHLSNLLDEPVAQKFPILFMNATEVGTGKSIVQSWVRLDLADDADVTANGPPGLRVSTAAVLSARFPLVTPPARYVQDGYVAQIVDGGYFDNSGIETIFEVLKTIDEVDALKKRKIEIVSYDVIEGDPSKPADPPGISGTFGAPAATFYNAWLTHRKLSEDRLRAISRDSAVLHEPIPIYTGDFNFTLSWLLNDKTFDMIECQIEGFALKQAPDKVSRHCLS